MISVSSGSTKAPRIGVTLDFGSLGSGRIVKCSSRGAMKLLPWGSLMNTLAHGIALMETRLDRGGGGDVTSLSGPLKGSMIIIRPAMTMTTPMMITMANLTIPNSPLLSEVWCYGEADNAFRQHLLKGVAPLLNLSLNHFKECWHLKIIHFFFAIKVSNFCPLDEFTETVDAEIRTVRNATRAEGIERICISGEIEGCTSRMRCVTASDCIQRT